MKGKEKNPLFVGILSIILGLLFPLGGIGLGITSLLYANSLQKESGLDYKTEKNYSYCRDCSFRKFNWVFRIDSFL